MVDICATILPSVLRGSGMLPTVAAVSAELKSEFGDIDIYLFDQLLRGRLDGRRARARRRVRRRT